MKQACLIFMLIAFQSAHAFAPIKNLEFTPEPQTLIEDPVPRAEHASRRGNPPVYEVLGERYFVANSSQGYREEGIASWYGPNFHGKLTSSGETYDMYLMTAANKELPIPCYVQVTNLENGRQIIVKVNDRGPFHEGRIIDLSYTAAQKLDMLKHGTAQVRVEALPPFQKLPLLANAIQSAHQQFQNLYLQIGAFGVKANADNFAAQIKQIVSKPVKIFQTKHAFGNIYRVKVGPFLTSQEATKINEQLNIAGMSKGMFVYL